MEQTARAALAWLLGHRVQRVDGPRPGLLAITLYQRGEKQTLLLAFASNQRGVSASAERPKGEAAAGFIQRLRGQLEGARLRSASWYEAAQADHAVALRLSFERGEHHAEIVVDFDAAAPNLFLLRPDHTVAGAADERARRARFPDKTRPYAPGRGKGISTPEDAAALAQASLLEASPSEAGDPLRNAARAHVRGALKKADRKVAAIEGDLARVSETPRLRREANLLLCNLDQVPRGASQVSLLDQSVEPAEWVELALDPSLDARRLAEQRFERARKLERGLAIASERLASARAEAERLRAQLDAIETATPEQLEAQLGIRAGERKPRSKQPRARVPFRTFYGQNGEPMFVGKSAADNDTLTLTVARPHDHWLHVRGSAGSHVVVPLEKKALIAPELLLDAAHLAAHFSQQRGEPTVEIAHTERRFVRKTRGSAPGSVNVDRERVFVLRFEAARLTRLLANEKSL